MELILHSRKSCDTLLPDDMSHLCHFGSNVSTEIWHVQSGVACMHVINYSYSSVLIYFALDCKSVLFHSSHFFNIHLVKFLTSVNWYLEAGFKGSRVFTTNAQ
jgi:hypothetical protein